MKHNLSIYILVISLVFVAGCLSGGPASGTDASGATPTATMAGGDGSDVTPTGAPEEDAPTPTPGGVCVAETSEDFDPGRTLCLVDEEPPDLRIDNFDNESHVVSVQIIKNGSAVTYENNVTIEPAGSDGYTRLALKDVIDAPGDYEIRATVDGEYSDSATWTVGERYSETGSEQWEINIDREYGVLVKRVATM